LKAPLVVVMLKSKLQALPSGSGHLGFGKALNERSHLLVLAVFPHGQAMASC